MTEQNEVKRKEQDATEIVPQESPATELGQVLIGGDPETQLAILEKKAELAPRFNKAIATILVAQTYPEDWKVFGEGENAKACLSSAGAERVARLFEIQFFEVRCEKQEFTDSLGKAYRYVFSGKASYLGRVVFSQGVYGSRDKFLGYANKEYKDLTEINENHIRQAAYHIFVGNAVKCLLGIRGMPLKHYQELMKIAGQNPASTGSVNHKSGSQGGTTKTDSEKQTQLYELCSQIADANMIPKESKGDNGKSVYTLIEYDGEMMGDELINLICIKMSSFTNNEGKEIIGKKVADMKGGWLNTTLGRAKELVEQLTNA